MKKKMFFINLHFSVLLAPLTAILSVILKICPYFYCGQIFIKKSSLPLWYLGSRSNKVFVINYEILLNDFLKSITLVLMY